MKLGCRRVFHLASCIALIGACGQPASTSSEGDASPPVDGPQSPEEVLSEPDAGGPSEHGEGLLDCAPPLTVTPELAYVLPHGLVFLVAEGGAGNYEFLLTDESLGSLNVRTGAFLAGAEAGVSSRVFVTDEGCSGVAEAELQVVHPLTVIPQHPEVPPGTTIPFRVEDGSGQVTFELAQTTTGATLSGNEYVAGDIEGVDTLKVLDVETGEAAFVYVEVRTDAVLRPTTNWVHVALGQAFVFEVEGGTGDFAFELTGGGPPSRTGSLRASLSDGLTC